MFLEIENQIINLDLVTVIKVVQTTQGIWSVQIVAEKDNILYNRDFHSSEEAVAYGNKFSDLLKPTRFE